MARVYRSTISLQLFPHLSSVACAYMYRKPCLVKASSYLTCPVVAPPDTPEKPPGLPICVANKNKCHQCIKNIFIDDKGFPSQSDDFNTLLQNIHGGPFLWKLIHPPLPLNITDLLFSFRYDESVHGKTLCKYLDLSDLDTSLQDCIYALVWKYWAVFDNRRVFVPVKNYKCIIDTGDAPPNAVKKIQYGPKETPIMR
jgi:hypothetical protein